MKKRIAALVLALVMVLGLVPSVAFAEEEGSIKIYMSVSNAGTLATCNDGEAMAFREVTVTDYDADNMITFHEALIAAHNTYFDGGAEAGYGYDEGGFVQKVWGVANGGSYFFNQNGVSIPVGVMGQEIAENDYLTVCIMKDAEGFSDVANTYFKDASDHIVNRVEINATDALELTLIGCVLDYSTWQTVPTALPNIAIGIWQDGFQQLGSLKTGDDGKVSVSFTQPGKYVLTAEGQLDGKTIMAPTCLVTVKSTDIDPTDPTDPTDPEEPTDPGTTDTPKDVSAVLNDTMAQLAAKIPEPAFGSTGGEWTVLCLARGGYYEKDDAYFTGYYDRIVEYVNETAASVSLANGALHKTKSTENSRLILALSAIGKDATSVGDWNLITPYEDFSWIKKQGINGPIFALLALDSHNYTTTDTTIRQQCVDDILSKELEGGGWALTGTAADPDPDITAMALQALAKYKDQPAVKAAADDAFTVLSNMQQDNGGYVSWGSENCESIAQVIVAATAWDINPDTDSRFVKNGKSAVDAILTFYDSSAKAFKHVADKPVDVMATDQACYALIAYDRFLKGKTALYDMSDVDFSDIPEPGTVPTPGQNPSTTKPGSNAGSSTSAGSTVKSADTGDSSQMTLWMGGVLLSAAALIVLTRKRKRGAE